MVIGHPYTQSHATGVKHNGGSRTQRDRNQLAIERWSCSGIGKRASMSDLAETRFRGLALLESDDRGEIDLDRPLASCCRASRNQPRQRAGGRSSSRT